MADTMRAERFYADTKTVALEDVPIPEPGPGEVLVKVAFCGICHSDLSLINGTFPAQRPVVTQGHEASGTIAKAPAEDWKFVGIADGTAGWFRFYPAAGNPALSSATEARIDGNIATSGGDLNISNIAVKIGVPNTVDVFQFTMPAQ